MKPLFDDIAGNEPIKKCLKSMVEKKAIGNSLLFAGPEGVGKSLFAKDLARHLLKKEAVDNHPDYHFYRPEGKIGMHSIASMRAFSEDVFMRPFEAEWKVFIIEDADRMLPYSANALLKTFEEPAKDSVIILISSSPESLLPTVLSRCRTVRFQSLTSDEIALVLHRKLNKGIEEARHAASIAEGSLSRALHLMEEGGSRLRELVLGLLEKGKLARYYDLTDSVGEIASHVDERKKQEESEIRDSLKKGFQDLTAHQKEAIEKEVEGAIAMELNAQADAIFKIVLSWYRDMQLLAIGGALSSLINKDRKNAIEQALQRGLFLPLEFVQKAIADAKLSLERSTALSICLERLFLQLNFL